MKRTLLGLLIVCVALPMRAGAAEGTLVIETDPSGLEVLIDGRSAGTSPVEVHVEAGAHEVVVRDRCHAELTRRLDVLAGARVNQWLSPRPRTARLAVHVIGADSRPVRAELFVDELNIGRSGGVSLVPVCASRLRAVEGKRKAARVLSLKPDAEARMTIALGRPVGDVTLPDVDKRDLDSDELRILAQALDEQADACGGSGSLLDALKVKGACSQARRVAAYGVTLAGHGLNHRQISDALEERARRLSRRHDFTLENRPSHGPADASVVVVEYYDYECGYCRKAAQQVPAIIRGRPVRVVYKQFPLPFHQMAVPAAVAVLAAHEQGRFDSVHEALLEHGDQLTEPLIERLLADAGVNMKRHRAARAAAIRQLEADKQEATRAGLDGTPTFYVNGAECTLDELDEMITAELAK